MPSLEHQFRTTLIRYIQNPGVADRVWAEIEKAHSANWRHYHDLSHLDHILAQLDAVKRKIQEWEPLIFAISYHDIIQNMFRKDDEERSAAFMRERLGPLGIPEDILHRAEAHILATKHHNATGDPDTDLFTDADLSILGSRRTEYAHYAACIRKEYALVPDLLYSSGRKKVLTYFMERERIFHSPAFSHLENTARDNMRWELARL